MHNHGQTEPMVSSPRDPLDDSLSYSPLKDVTNKENSAALLLSGMDRVRKSPSTTRLLALFGSRNDFVLASPADAGITPKRLQDFWDTPSKPGLEECTPNPDFVVHQPDSAELKAEINSLRASMSLIRKDCEFHRQRAVVAHDQVDILNKQIATLEDELRKSAAPPRPSSPPTLADKEKKTLLDTIASLESLNRSLARQNDLLRSRSSVTGRFEKKDARIQTDEKTTVSVGVNSIHPPVAPVVQQRSEIHIEHVINSPAVKISRVMYIKDAETQTDAPVWASTPEKPLPAISYCVQLPTFDKVDSATSQCMQLPISLRTSTPEKDGPISLPVPVPEVSVVPVYSPGDYADRVRGYPFRAALRSRRSLPSYTNHSNSPSERTEKRRLSVPKPAPVPDDSPRDWQTEWRTLSSARRNRSNSKPRWVP
jgi:hypothetical protein